MIKRVKILRDSGINTFKKDEIVKVYREDYRHYPSGYKKSYLCWSNGLQRCVWLKAEEVEEIA